MLNAHIGFGDESDSPCFGLLFLGYKDVFFNKIKNITMLNYLGVVQPTDVYSTFSNYDLSVLPTKYPGEGFPGTVLDSYISAVPVIVSNWRHLPEFVKHGKTGFIFNLDNIVNKIYRNFF